ncbi:DUF6496 domain-containing protein [Corallococcus sp. EGB]|uniref:DUF6496 domain-containing protein n=1 Tax=Corallococcus sp. EGB TaxID=1521117 RepID=UPI001CBEE197|nr:DUF6496 domain-containing protein [Corallococcus sp. EGB]
MPDKATVERAKKDLREGKSPSTAAGEFVHEELEHIRGGEHGARSSKQAIAIGLSEARRAGVPLKPPRKEQASARTRRSAKKDLEVGQQERKPRAPSKKRSKAIEGVLQRESRQAASKQALSAQAKSASRRRKTTARKTAARRAAATRKSSSRPRK